MSALELPAAFGEQRPSAPDAAALLLALVCEVLADLTVGRAECVVAQCTFPARPRSSS